MDDFDPSTATLTEPAPQSAHDFDPSTATLTQAAPAPQTATTYDPTGTVGQNVAAGAGKAVVDTGNFVYRLGAAMGHAAGLVSDEKMAKIQADQAERERLDKALMGTNAARAGYLAGMVGEGLAIPGAAGEVAGAAGDAAKIASGVGRAAASGIGTAINTAKAAARVAHPYTDVLAKAGQTLGGIALAKHYLFGDENKHAGASAASDIKDRLNDLHELVTKYGEQE